MNDTGKMGTEGTKLFWKLFTTSIHCRGVSDKKIQSHIMNFKLFMYWARKHNRKLQIKRMFFQPPMTPYTLIEKMLVTGNQWARYARQVAYEDNEVDYVWKEIFRTKFCYVSGMLNPNDKNDKFNTPSEVAKKLLDIEYDWKLFFEKAKIDLI
jgi:hypothetical protein